MWYILVLLWDLDEWWLIYLLYGFVGDNELGELRKGVSWSI